MLQPQDIDMSKPLNVRLHSQGELIAKGIKVATQLTLKYYPDYNDGPYGITGLFKCGRRRQKSQERGCGEESKVRVMCGRYSTSQC